MRTLRSGASALSRRARVRGFTMAAQTARAYAPLCGAIGGCADPKARAVIAEALEAAIGPALATS